MGGLHGKDDTIRQGLPGDWSDVARGPAKFVLPKPGWRELMTRYGGMRPSAPLDEIFNVTVGRESPTRVLLESGYIDEDFRDEYVSFYAKTHRDLPRRCERLHFFDDREEHREDYLGYVVIRPIVYRPVCRTMLRPPAHLARYVSCTARYTTTPWGYRKHVDGFPFLSQDSQFGSCAHAAIWMIALYFHLRFGRPRYHLSDLVRSASVHHDFHRAVPTSGLTPRQISAVLHDLDMTPMIYELDRLEDIAETAEAIACRYLNSALPVMLLTEQGESRHAQVLIGYGRDDDGLFFVYHDDQKGPYLKTRQLSGDADRQALVIPMPGRIYLSGEEAVKWARHTINEMATQHDHLSWLSEGLQDSRLRLQPYVIDIGDYKRGLRRRQAHHDVVVWHTGISTSHWVWVVELQLRDAARAGGSCVLGEIVFDATSDDQWINALFGNLPRITMQWPSLGEDIVTGTSGQDETPYLTGCPLHVAD